VNDANINTTDILGQLMMPRLEITKFENDETYRVFIKGLLEKKIVGGFCIFGELLKVFQSSLRTSRFCKKEWIAATLNELRLRVGFADAIE